MKIKNIFAFVAVAGLIAACDTKPEGDTAEVGEAQEVQEVSAEAVSYNIAADNSKVGWIGLKPGGRHYGTFGLESGELQVEGDKIVGGTITMNLNNIDVADLEGKQESDLAGHLKSGDFFDVENYPNATFEITSVEAIEGASDAATLSEDSKKEVDDDAKAFMPVVENPTHRITGNLTMRGQTKSVTFPARVSMDGNKIMANARFVIDRTDWGVSYGDESGVVDKTKDKFIYNNVAVGFDLNASK